MNRFFKILMPLVAASVTFFSCSKDITDDSINPENSFGTILYAQTPIIVDTRIDFNDNGSGIALSWQDGDIFTVYEKESGKRVGDFKCIDSNEGKFSSTGTLKKGVRYVSIYPKSDDNTLEDARGRDLTTVQDGDAISNLNNACVMEATFTYNSDSTLSMDFAHKKSVMIFKFEKIGDKLPAKLQFQNGDNDKIYSVIYDELSPDDSGIYTSYIMVDPCDAAARVLTFSLFDDEGNIYDTRYVMSTKGYRTGNCYSADVSTIVSYTVSGDGSESFPYLIGSAKFLAELANNVNSSTAVKSVTVEDGYSGKHFKLINDIDLGCLESGIDWTPIGNDVNPFKGIFNGNGKTVKGLHINKTTSDSESTYLGLFGYLNGATISNLTVNGEITNQLARSYVGGVAGYATASSFENCTNNVSLEISFETGYISSIGGIVGKSEDSFVINNCTNNGTVTSKYFTYTGGIVGLNDATTVSNCINYANISGSKFCSTGGIVGQNMSNTINDIYGLIINCSNLGERVEISDCVGKSMSVGGVVGTISSAYVINCYNKATVKGEDSDSQYSLNNIGGIAGSFSNRESVMVNCYNVGAVIYEGNNAYKPNIGAISGSLSSDSRPSYNYYSLDASFGKNGTLKADVGVGGKYSNNAYNVKGKSEEYMKSSDFITLLNDNVDSYNGSASNPEPDAHYWKLDVTMNDGFPIFDTILQ